MDFGGGDQIRFERSGKAGIVTLTRPKALNAVTHAMVKALSAALAAWEDDPAVAVVDGQGGGQGVFRRRRHPGHLRGRPRRQAAGRVLRRRVPAQRRRSSGSGNPMSR